MEVHAGDLVILVLAGLDGCSIDLDLHILKFACNTCDVTSEPLKVCTHPILEYYQLVKVTFFIGYCCLDISALIDKFDDLIYIAGHRFHSQVLKPFDKSTEPVCEFVVAFLAVSFDLSVQVFFLEAGFILQDVSLNRGDLIYRKIRVPVRSQEHSAKVLVP